MRLVGATATDGRVFRASEGGFQIVGREPASLVPMQGVSPALGRILRPQAAYRWLLPQLASITPQYVEQTLRSALAGNHVQQWELFDLMSDTWPELASCQQELVDGVQRKKLIFEPFAEEDEEPSDSAIERCKLVSAALRRMAPDAAADENDLDGTLRDVLDGWFRGVTALEIDWQATGAGAQGTIIAPRATFWVHPACFAFNQEGRLGLRLASVPGHVSGGMASAVAAFPPHKFLVGIHKGKSGSALGGAVLRPLAWWWCAANFSADWLLNLAQIFGLPFRWANFDPNAPQATIDAICSMLQNMGSAGWAAFPAGTTLELKEAAGRSGDHSPQGELLDRADRYARLLLLGQTMSGSQDASKGGGKAFGSVEADVKGNRIDAAGKYACRILNTQLIPSILALNYGDADEAPTVRLLEDEEGDFTEAQRDIALATGGLEIGKNFLRKKYGIPAPSKDEETIGGKAAAAGQRHTLPGEDDEEEEQEEIAAGEDAGHPFRGNQHTGGRAGAGKAAKPPRRISMEEADRLLTRGITEHGSDGAKVRFGERLKRKLDESAPERKELLNWARETVRSGVAAKVVEKGEARTVYSKLFAEGGKEKGFITIVDTEDGEAFNIYRKDAGAIRRGKHLKGEPVKGRQAEEQPPEPVLQAIAAAGGLLDYPNDTALAARLQEIAAIADDAVFARELRAFAQSL